jgi:hypothetical protein
LGLGRFEETGDIDGGEFFFIVLPTAVLDILLSAAFASQQRPFLFFFHINSVQEMDIDQVHSSDGFSQCILDFFIECA